MKGHIDLHEKGVRLNDLALLSCFVYFYKGQASCQDEGGEFTPTEAFSLS